MTKTREADRDDYANKTNAFDGSTVSSSRYAINSMNQRTSDTPRSTGILPVVSNAIAIPKNHPTNPRTPLMTPQQPNLIWDAEKCDEKESMLDKGEACGRRVSLSIPRESNPNCLIEI